MSIFSLETKFKTKLFLLGIFLLMFCFCIVVCSAHLYKSSLAAAATEKHDFWYINDLEQLKSPQFWFDDAQNALHEKLKAHANKNIAKNVILFLGDGMSVATATAGRIYDGQMRGIIGERNRLFFEKFPYVALSKTYCVDRQVADSACTATAYLCGIKANYETLGVTANVSLNDCDAANFALNRVDSIAGWAIEAGKTAGIVTNTRITHATPGGAYAHSASRNFESDFDVFNQKQDPSKCIDIARQLVENPIPRKFKVILGGGVKKFLSNQTKDSFGNFGERLDGRHLIDEWLEMKAADSCSSGSSSSCAKFVSSRAELLSTNVEKTDYLLGLFNTDHLDYHLDGALNQPRLVEMSEVAIKMLQKHKQGYFLLIEGGRIDQAHHQTTATKALDETVEFAEAVKRAYEITDPKDTLIVVTADHSHTMTISGYPSIGNSINGIGTDINEADGLAYSTLSYANGPGFKKFFTISKKGEVDRVDLKTFQDFGDKDFKFPAAVLLNDETHGGDDVAVYANGPWAHLFSGVIEQNSLASFMGFASCIGPGLHACQV